MKDASKHMEEPRILSHPEEPRQVGPRMVWMCGKPSGYKADFGRYQGPESLRGDYHIQGYLLPIQHKILTQMGF